MIGLPKPPKQPRVSAPLGVWKDYYARLGEWIHVLEQVQNYQAHKDRKAGSGSSAPRFTQTRRTKRNPFPKNKLQREYEKRRG